MTRSIMYDSEDEYGVHRFETGRPCRPRKRRERPRCMCENVPGPTGVPTPRGSTGGNSPRRSSKEVYSDYCWSVSWFRADGGVACLSWSLCVECFLGDAKHLLETSRSTRVLPTCGYLGYQCLPLFDHIKWKSCVRNSGNIEIFRALAGYIVNELLPNLTALSTPRLH